MNTALEQQRRYLAQLLEATQRCAFFLDHSIGKLEWPLHGTFLATHNKDPELFETLAAINERFAKLQDILASAMRHCAILMGESVETFLKVLATFEKAGVIESISDWQQGRALRNLAAHEYDLDYASMAEHFNALHQLTPMLLQTAHRLLQQASTNLDIVPATNDFAEDFARLTA